MRRQGKQDQRVQNFDKTKEMWPFLGVDDHIIMMMMILKNQGCYVRYFSAKSALRAFNLWSALECVKSALYLLCFHKI